MRLIIACVLAVAIATPAAAVYVGSVTAECTDQQMTITVFVQHLQPEDDAVGALVHRTTDGVCDSDVVLNPDAPLALPADSGSLTHVLVDEVATGLGFTYWATLLFPDGSETAFSFPYPTYSVAGCGDWPLGRGVLLEADPSGYAFMESCECWYMAYILDLSAIDPDVYTPLIGQMVEIRGEARFDEMPGSPNAIVTDIRMVDGCDAPVSAQAMSWSTVKRLYE